MCKVKLKTLTFLCFVGVMGVIFADYVAIRRNFLGTLVQPMMWGLTGHIDKMGDVCIWVMIYIFLNGIWLLRENFAPKNVRLVVIDKVVEIASMLFDWLLCIVFLALLAMQALNFLWAIY